MDIATENYRLINEGIELSLVFKLPHNTLITNALLSAFILISLTALFLYYRRWSMRYQREAALNAEQLARLSEMETLYRRQLESLQKERAAMAQDVDQLKLELERQKKKADSNEEEMLEELIALEAEISKKEEQQALQNQQLQELQLKLNQSTASLEKADNRKRKPIDSARKRLTTLYKNLEIHDKAIEGYSALTDELKLKCEEIIVQLNENPASISVKRKVFGKSNRVPALEVVFGYKGRLYYIPKGEKRAELLVIGTKNSQQQDLGYLDRL